MHNWDYDPTTGQGDEFIRWKLERLVNYGLKPNERLPVKPLKKFWNQLEIDPQRRRFLKLLLWRK